jgi:hypothetical protein
LHDRARPKTLTTPLCWRARVPAATPHFPAPSLSPLAQSDIDALTCPTNRNPASCRAAPDCRPFGHQAVAIVLDLVDPCRPAGSLLGGAWETRLKPRGRGVFAPGTRMAVHRADQTGGQGIRDGYPAGVPEATASQNFTRTHLGPGRKLQKFGNAQRLDGTPLPIPAQAIEGLKAGTAAIYAYGVIDFVDAFKKSRWVKYRYMTNFPPEDETSHDR